MYIFNLWTNLGPNFNKGSLPKSKVRIMDPNLSHRNVKDKESHRPSSGQT